MATVQRTRKPKTNSFTSILDQILDKYNLSAESNPLQLQGGDKSITHFYFYDIGKILHVIEKLFFRTTYYINCPNEISMFT